MCLMNYLKRDENHDTFEQFVESKFGYGTWEAPYWFVGPEEGGGANCVELADRLIAWNGLSSGDRHYAGLLNLREYCGAIDEMQFFGNNAISQPTWIKLLSLLGQPYPHQGPPQWFNHEIPAGWEQEDLNNWALLYQREFLGQPDMEMPGRSHGSRIALLNISPLPSPNMDMWLWGCIAAEPVEQLPHPDEFESRESFLLAADIAGVRRLHRRVSFIRDRIHESKHKDKLVVFYGVFRRGALQNAFVEEMGDHFHFACPTVNEPVQYSQIDQTNLFWIYHPNYWGRRQNVNRAAIQAAMEQHGVTPWFDP